MDVSKARAILLYELPYLAELAFATPVRETELLPTAGVTRNGVLWVNPRFWESLSPREQAFVLGHELLHLLLDHAGRVGDRDPELWNVAVDVVVNEALTQGISRHGWGLVPPKEPAPILARDVGLWDAARLTGEEIYELLRREGRRVETNLLRGACGSGAGGNPLPAELEAEKGLSDTERALLRRKTLAEAKAWGNLPLGVLREVEGLLEPKVPWPQLLRAYLRGSLAQALGKSDFTFRKPSRRSDEAILPSLQRPLLRVVTVVDTSGSMGEAELAQAVAEVEAVAREVAEVTLLSCDAEVHARGRVQGRRDAQKLLRGGGGTDMGVGLAEALKLRPDVIVVLTDGYTPWPEKSPAVPVIVVLLGEGEAPAWAKTVRVEVRP